MRLILLLLTLALLSGCADLHQNQLKYAIEHCEDKEGIYNIDVDILRDYTFEVHCKDGSKHKIPWEIKNDNN